MTSSVRRCPQCRKELPDRTSTWRYCSKQCQDRQGQEKPDEIARIARFFRDLDAAAPWERAEVIRAFLNRSA